MKKYIDQELVPLKTQINHLENLFNRLEENYESLHSTTEHLSQALHIVENRPPDPPQRPENDQQIVIQKVNIEKILLDKYEQTNNFGQLGIKDISGQLNIGATYGKGVIPAELVENLMEILMKLKILIIYIHQMNLAAKVSMNHPKRKAQIMETLKIFLSNNK